METLFDPGYTGTVIELGNGVRIGLVEVTPELAKDWLDNRNTHNRTISETSVRAYIRDVLGGDWPFTGDPVRFSDCGVVLDGQHRLTAIRDTEHTIVMLVITGLDRSTQEYMDGGKKRNAADALALEDVPNYAAVSAVTKLALTWNPGGLWSEDRPTALFGRRMPVTTPEILKFTRTHPRVHEATRRGMHAARMIPGARPSVLGTGYLRAMYLEDDGVFTVAGWFHRLETGANLSLGDPVLALRNGFLRVSNERLANPQIPQLFKLIRAWNASRAGEDMGRIILPTNKLTNANFPDMR